MSFRRGSVGRVFAPLIIFMEKKILYFITKSNFGGAQRYVYDLATAMPKDSYKVTVLMGGKGLLKEKLESEGVRTITLPQLERDIHVWNDIKTFFALIQLLRKERPDIIHLNSSKAGILGALATRLCNLSKVKGQRSKVIFTAHGWAFNENRPSLEKLFFLLLHWKTILFSHRTIMVSETTKKQVAFLPFIRKKIIVIPNSIKKPTFETRESARSFLASRSEGLRFGSERLWIGSIAELHTTKGLSYAISALALLKERIPNVAYVIVGEGEERQNLEQEIKRHGLEKNVFLAGFIENAARYLSAFDIFLLPSLSEASPYAPLEAGYAKLPIVASKVGGIPELITNKKSGILVEARDSHVIAESIGELASHPQLQKKYGEELCRFIEKNLPFEAMIQKTIEIYTTI